MMDENLLWIYLMMSYGILCFGIYVMWRQKGTNDKAVNALAYAAGVVVSLRNELNKFQDTPTFKVQHTKVCRKCHKFVSFKHEGGCPKCGFGHSGVEITLTGQWIDTGLIGANEMCDKCGAINHDGPCYANWSYGDGHLSQVGRDRR